MMKRNVSTGLTLSNEKQITHDTFYLLVDLAAYINIEFAQKLFVVIVFLLFFFGRCFCNGAGCSSCGVVGAVGVNVNYD